MPQLREIEEFLHALMDNAIAIWGGILSFALTIGSLYIEPETAKRIAWGAAAFSFIMAMFSMWLKEHRTAKSALAANKTDPLMAARQVQLEEILKTLSQESRDLFWEIVWKKVIPDSPPGSRPEPLRRLFAAQLIYCDNVIGTISVVPAYLDAAEAMYKAQMAASNSSNSQT